jgi:hypothetical protein
VVLTCVMQELHRRMRKDLEKIKGFSEVKVDKLKEAAKKMMVCLKVHE